jgi:hypothetical protein
MPLVRSSPSGRPVARTKNPLTIASATPFAAHQAASGVGRGKRTTRTSVRLSRYVAMCSVVQPPSARRRRSERRWDGDGRPAGAGSERIGRRAALDTRRRVAGAPRAGVTAP